MIEKILAKVVRIVCPDVDAIITQFLKAQDKLKALIERELTKLASDTGMIVALQARQVERNATIDRAYRIINNIDGLVA